MKTKIMGLRHTTEDGHRMHLKRSLVGQSDYMKEFEEVKVKRKIQAELQIIIKEDR